MAAARLGPALRAFWRVHRWLYRVSGGRIGSRLNGFEIVMLTTTGRTSGQPRAVALYSLRQDDGWAVIASYVGEDRHPAWWLNLLAQPMATVEFQGRRVAVRAREASGEERAALWNAFVAVDDAYAEYQRRTTRVLPVVVLEPS